MYDLSFETRDRLDKKEIVMKKRLALLLVLTFVLTAFAPLAMADHCRKCSGTRCVIAFTGGKPACDDSSGACVLSGPLCTGPHPREAEPLAVEFTVVEVERLDEPQTAVTETRVAAARATTQTDTR